MFDTFNQGWVGIAIYAAVDCLMIVLGVQISDAISRWYESRSKRKFYDIICEACNKAGRKLYLCADTNGAVVLDDSPRGLSTGPVVRRK